LPLHNLTTWYAPKDWRGAYELHVKKSGSITVSLKKEKLDLGKKTATTIALTSERPCWRTMLIRARNSISLRHFYKARANSYQKPVSRIKGVKTVYKSGVINKDWGKEFQS